MGDSIGLPYEGLSRAAVARLTAGRPLEQSLLLGNGIISDDTEHSVLVALSCLEARDDVEKFRKALARRLKGWLLALPPTLGGATARAGAKLLAGVNPARSGVWSAGNGAAMRAPILGVLLGDQPSLLAQYVGASTYLTHSDPQAYDASLAAAVAAHCAAKSGPHQAPSAALAEFLFTYQEYRPPGDPLPPALAGLSDALSSGLSLAQFANKLGCSAGVTGYAWHTVPVAIYAWLLHSGDLRAAITKSILCGGDTDSVAAITGAIVGAGLGPDQVPATWLSNLVLGTRNQTWLARLAHRLATPLSSPLRGLEGSVLVWWVRSLVWNIAVLAVVLCVAAARAARVLLAQLR